MSDQGYTDDDLRQLLKRHFGFNAFRPHQERIIRNVLAGSDVFALLPTGGGKSLCFQLPALVEDGFTLVISPLIALMKGQVDALQASGIPATFLNSSVSPPENRARFAGLIAGEYKLLYVAPERLMIPGFLEKLKAANLRRLAIDEAHCISEWGHDFRPEYRQLRQIRSVFPSLPIIALTATATERVRRDIIEQLELREPSVHIGSFNRPNLRYRVSPKKGAYQQTLRFIRERPEECGIVYCSSRSGADALTAQLRADGIAALPYHAGLDASVRGKNQEAFQRDDARVICATIAFGMGIDKSNVRFVIHYDLPKNIESYYQETGRAGRDGLPSDCLLLFSVGDKIKQLRFIDEKPREERVVAQEQLEQMVRFAKTTECRRKALLRYFEESFPHANCRGCDNCENGPEKYDGTLAAQKLLSCVFRIRERDSGSSSLSLVAAVLTGAQSEELTARSLAEISTYGIGRELAGPEWESIGECLLSAGLLTAGASPDTVELTPEGRLALTRRERIFLSVSRTKTSAAMPATDHRDEFSSASSHTSPASDFPFDEKLFGHLKVLRRKLADELEVPAFVVFSDASLRQMAREYPSNPQEFRRISGVGERKLDQYGPAFLSAISDFLKDNPKLDL